MKENLKESPLDRLDKVLENHIRFLIMLFLNSQGWVSFKKLMRMLNISYGRLATQLKKLEEANYIEVKKEFVDRKPSTAQKITITGKIALQKYLDELKDLIAICE